MLKKIISIIMLFLLTFWSFQNSAFATNKEKTYFRVTAYYSPLAWQSHYIKWTYQKELTMNWIGIRWASWKRVFSWMLAAPSKYSFWTKIKLKWLWIWEVSDRWGAIVKAWERKFKYDRIDIWCGYWEKGLQRAMYWGNRVVEWEIVTRKSRVNLNIKNIPAPRWTIYHAIKNPDLVLKKRTIKRRIYLAWNKVKSNTKNIKKNIFSWPIKDSNSVKKLQKILTEMKKYTGKINWKYSDIKWIILKFQIENKIISTKSQKGAGNFWPKTRKVLEKKYKIFLKAREIAIKKEERIKKAKENLFKKPIQNKEWVIELQKVLDEMKIYSWKIDWDYSKIRWVILTFQLENNLISDKKEKGAGNFWPKTRKTLEKKYKEFKIKQEEERIKKIELEKKLKKAREEAEKRINSIWEIKFWDISNDVRMCQMALKEVWFFNYKDTAIFWEKTRQSIINYQLDRKLISNKKIYWAGMFWPKTRKMLIKDLSEK